MKKSVMLTVMGLSLAAASTAFGQGNVAIGNYQTGYNEVFWAPDQAGVLRGGLGVLASEGVQLQVWFGAGVAAEGALTAGPMLSWDLVNQGNGYPGYYSFQTIQLPAAGTYTFQIRAFGDSAFGIVDAIRSRSALWQVNANAVTDPPTPPNQDPISMGFAVFVPEPSSFALLGLGAAGMLFLRRRQG